MHIHVNGQRHWGGLRSAVIGHGLTPQQLITRERLGASGPFGPRFPGFDRSHDGFVVVMEVGKCRIDLGWPQIRMLPQNLFR